MIVLGGFTRFPIFFSSDGKRSLGTLNNNEDFNYYIRFLKGKFVIIQALQNIQFKSRFIVEGVSINPELNIAEDLPNHIYIYPDSEPEDIITNAFTFGFTLKGGRNAVYVPLLSQRILSKEEANAFLGIIEVEDFGLKKFQIFLNQLGIILNIEKEVTNQRSIVKISDPQVRGVYRALITNDGKVLDVDFCVDNYQHLYISELVMFCRESRSVNHISGFNY